MAWYTSPRGGVGDTQVHPEGDVRPPGEGGQFGFGRTTREMINAKARSRSRQAHPVRHRPHRRDVPVGQATGDGDLLIGLDQWLAGQYRPDRRDRLRGQGREVGQGLLARPARAVTVRAAQQVTLVPPRCRPCARAVSAPSRRASPPTTGSFLNRAP